MVEINRQTSIQPVRKSTEQSSVSAIFVKKRGFSTSWKSRIGFWWYLKIQNKVTGLHFIKEALFLCASTKTRDDVEKNWSEEYFFPLGKIVNYRKKSIGCLFSKYGTDTPCNTIFICQIRKTVSYDIPSDQFRRYVLGIFCDPRYLVLFDRV